MLVGVVPGNNVGLERYGQFELVYRERTGVENVELRGIPRSACGWLVRVRIHGKWIMIG